MKKTGGKKKLLVQLTSGVLVGIVGDELMYCGSRKESAVSILGAVFQSHSGRGNHLGFNGVHHQIQN